MSLIYIMMRVHAVLQLRSKTNKMVIVDLEPYLQELDLVGNCSGDINYNVILMKFFKNIVKVFSVCCLAACSSDDLPTGSQIFDSDIINGAILRTVEFRSTEFRVNDPNSFIDILIEEQDEDDSNLLDFVEVFISFEDNTDDGVDLSSSEILFDTIDNDQFTRTGQILEPLGEEPLLQTVLNYSFEQMLEALNLPISSANCGDQIMIRTELNLTDGRSFSRNSISDFVGGLGTFFNSSFCYTINIIEPIQPELFTGTYFYESVLDGFFGPSFGASRLVEITTGHSENLRFVDFGFNPGNPFQFTVSCDEVIANKLQFTRLIGCELGATVLYGPGEVNAPVNPEDDSVFEVWLVEGDGGFDGDCGFGTVPSRIRFSRQ